MKKSYNKNYSFDFEGTSACYLQQFFNLYAANLIIDGVDYQQKNYIIRKLWRDGTFAISRAVNFDDEIVVTPYESVEYNLYDFPIYCYLINLRGSPLVNPFQLEIDKDVVLVWGLKSHEPILNFVRRKVEKIVACENLTFLNINALKMPYLITGASESTERLKWLMRKILDGEPAIFGGLDVGEAIKVFQTNAPYLIEKLQAYREQVINEVYTLLGVDNNGAQFKKERSIVDEVNANNEVINVHADCILDELNEGLERANNLFRTSIHASMKEPKVTSLHEQCKKITSNEEEEEGVEDE